MAGATGLRQVVAEDVVSHFLGRHQLAEVKKGLNGLINFIDQMGAIMTTSRPGIANLIVAESGNFLVECQRTRTNLNKVPILTIVSVLWLIFSRQDSSLFLCS